MRPVALLSGGLLCAAALIGAATLIVNSPDNPQVVPHHKGVLLVVNFAHADHTDQHCVDCHHNFVDDTGVGLCFDCHKSDPEIAPDIEAQFHDLCRGCHVENQLAGAEHGPTRSCIACHIADDRP